MKALLDGFLRFRRTYYLEHKRLFNELAKGQKPETIVISCSDSRVAPERIFDSEPGELFVVRNVAAIVPPYAGAGEIDSTSAALEFAVCILEVSNVVVLGHADCGGVKALLDPESMPEGEFLGAWIDLAKAARDRVFVRQPRRRDLRAVGDCHVACEHEVIKASLRNLMTFPWVQERVRQGKLQLFGCYFDVANAALLTLETSNGSVVSGWNILNCYHPAALGS